MSDTLAALLKRRKNKSFQDLAKVLTLLERKSGKAADYRVLFEPPRAPSLRIGVTGPPGAGKSTLIAQLVKDLRSQGLTVAVLAVDPSSPFTQGAILGDRIRFSDSFNDPGVFIRSIGSRGSSGGLTAAAYLMLRAFDLWNFDVVLIETVGVGQTELEVMYVADFVIVTLVPESGDAIQAMKAGLLEIADVFVVNKADRPGADAFARELKDSLELGGDAENVKVLLTSATKNDGISALTKLISSEKDKKKFILNRKDKRRLQAEARALLLLNESQKLEKKIQKIRTPKDLASCLK